MTRLSVILLTLITAFCFINSCSNCKSKKIVDEGIIEYAISYDDSLKPNFNANLLPNKFTVKFKGNSSLNKIEGLSGAVTITFIKNRENNTRLVLIKLLNKKLYYVDSLGKDSLNAFAGMPSIIIDRNAKDVHFKGYKCAKVSGFFNDSIKQPFDIIYTNEIKVDNPNASTPFESINGIMLKFKVKLYSHSMTFTATNIISTRISSDEFSVPEEYEPVSKKTIEEVIALIQ